MIENAYRPTLRAENGHNTRKIIVDKYDEQKPHQINNIIACNQNKYTSIT